MCEGKTLVREDTFITVPVLTQLDEFVEKAEAPEDILRLWEELGGNSNQAANILMKWVLLVSRTKGNFTELMADSRLQDMLTTISQQVGKPNTVVN